MKRANYMMLIILAALSFVPAKATAYCLPGKTASGEPVREGICAGGDKYYGKTIRVYQRKPDDSIGFFIGSYECCDKGGTDAIRNNYVVDIWRPTLNDCQEFMNTVYKDGCGGNVYIFVEE